MNLSKLGNVGFPNIFKTKPWNPQQNNAVICFHDSFMSSRPEGRTWSKVQGQLVDVWWVFLMTSTWGGTTSIAKIHMETSGNDLNDRYNHIYIIMSHLYPFVPSLNADGA
jgi:hypothetical protein